MQKIEWQTPRHPCDILGIYYPPDHTLEFQEKKNVLKQYTNQLVILTGCQYSFITS